jgi:hypothetical protein
MVRWGTRAAMEDPCLLRLMQDCDQYLARQRELLDFATVHGLPDGTAVAMEAALDQLATSVDWTWRLLDVDGQDPPWWGEGRSSGQPGDTEPGA